MGAFLAALRRFLLLTVGISVVTGVIAILFGEALGSSVARAVSLAFYGVGSFAMLSGVFIGSRGPVRVESETPGPGFIPFLGFFGKRKMRWASLSEQNETINNSAVFVAVGVVLLAIGILIDPKHKLF